MRFHQLCRSILLFLACATLAHAQPRIVALGGGAPVAVSNQTGGTYFIGGSGLSAAEAARWTLTGPTLTAANIGGSGSTAISVDGAFQAGTVPNTNPQLSGNSATNVTPPFSENPTLTPVPIATTEFKGARWSASNSSWQGLGALPIVPSLMVYGSGSSGSSSGNFQTCNAMSQNGRFIVGFGYISTYTNSSGNTISANTFQWRPWIWDAQADNGNGAFTVLPTPFRTSTNTWRRRTGNAYGVSNDGLVIVGAQEHNVSSSPAADPDGGRPVVWRWDANLNRYVMTFLPNGVNGSGFPYTYASTPGTFFINAAGTIIVGKAADNAGNLYIAKWTWNSDTSLWNAPENIGSNLTTPATWLPGAVTSCGVPPVLTPSGMSDDGNTIVGTAVYSTCGSFMSGGFIWTAASGMILDWYGYLQELGVPGVDTNGFYGPIGDNGDPTRGLPRLGFPSGIAAEGGAIVGFQGGTQRIPGAPPWIVQMAGGDCVPPLVTNHPASATFSVCSAPILNAAGAGTAPLSYQWRKGGVDLSDGTTVDGSVISGATSFQLRITSPHPSDAGNYDCVITGDCGSATTNTAVLTATPQVANDTCATATVVGEGTFNYTVCGAYFTEGGAGCTTSATTADVWYQYVPTQTRNIRIDTCGANYDTVITVYDQCNGQEIACNDNYDTGPSTNCPSTRSRIARMPVIQDVPVWIRIAVKGTFVSSTYTGQVTISAAPAPAPNDTCDAATPAALDTDANSNGNALDTTEATNDTIVTCNTSASRDVWMYYTAPTCERLRLITCPGTSWNTVLSVYDGCGGNQLACNDNLPSPAPSGCTTSQSLIPLVPMEAGQTIYIRVGGNATSAFGAGRLHITLLGDCNRDGTQTAADIPAFVSSLLSGTYNVCGDLDANGVVDGDDMQYFLDCMNF